MAFLISALSGYSPDEHPLYFFDTNVWLAVLKHTGSQRLESYEQTYIDFFEAIITLHTHSPKHQRKLKNVPKLVMTSMLLSEIINAYMRQVAFNAFKVGSSNTEFKRDYRPTADYQQQLRTITSDIQEYRAYIELVDDDFTGIDPFGLLSVFQSGAALYDFNDLYYYRLLRGKSVAIVTHDSDFLFPDIPILTVNAKLLGAGRGLNV